MSTTSLDRDLHDLPPLHVTTVGIPPDEHLTPHESHVRERELWRGSDRIAWIALWALVVMLGFFLIAIAVPPLTTTPTGQGPVAWTDYRAGERSPSSEFTTLAPNLASPFTGEAYAGLPRF